MNLYDTTVLAVNWKTPCACLLPLLLGLGWPLILLSYVFQQCFPQGLRCLCWHFSPKSFNYYDWLDDFASFFLLFFLLCGGRLPAVSQLSFCLLFFIFSLCKAEPKSQLCFTEPGTARRQPTPGLQVRAVALGRASPCAAQLLSCLWLWQYWDGPN